jgi:hypothetical protein
MKKLFLLLMLALFGFGAASAQQTMYICKGSTYTAVTLANAGDMTFSSAGTVLTVNGTAYTVADIDSITFAKPNFNNTTSSFVQVVYNGTTATVTIPSALASTVTCSSGTSSNVVITSTNTTDEIECQLSGTSTSGSFTYNGSYKCTISLKGVNLTSTKGAAIDIECGKRIALILEDGTTNTLADYASGSQKACFYCKGHMEVEGAGSLSVVGNVKHAISTNEYLQLKKTTGAITITSAANDGIHAGQYFQMNGGVLTISGTKGDCVQAEATTTTTDENNGQIIIKGGTLNLTVSSDDVKGLKADKDITVTGGTYVINVSGAGSKGISTDGNMTISEADNTTNMTIKATGGTYTDTTGDTSRCMGMNITGNLTISAGTITVTNTGDGSRGIKVDGTYSHTGGTVTANVSTASASSSDAPIGIYSGNFNIQEGAVLNLNCTGSYEVDGLKVDTLATFDGGTIGVTVASPSSKGIRASQNLVINGGTFTVTASGAASKGISAETFDVEGGTFTVKTTGAPVVTNYDPNYCVGFKANMYIQNGGNATMTCSGTATRGLSVDSIANIKNGTLAITCTGGGGSYRSSASAYDSYACNAISGDGALNLLGGTITLTCSGAGGKCIKADGTLNIGSGSTGPELTCTTSGATYSYSSSVTSKAKAIRCQGKITINAGTINVKTSTDGSEGIESKLKAVGSITVNGGDVTVVAYDDAINSAGTIVFNGGRTFARGTNNDGIDSNYGSTGAVAINGGIVIGVGTSSPEEGIDCDDNRYISITGGTVFSFG